MSWQTILGQGFFCAAELLKFLDLPANANVDYVEKQFKTRVPRGFAARMQKGNPKDPLLLQVLASLEELVEIDTFVHDPLAEVSQNPIRGLIHKYSGRVLVMLTGACAVHCRYCFRRHFPYQDNNPGQSGYTAIFDYIRQDQAFKK